MGVCQLMKVVCAVACWVTITSVFTLHTSVLLVARLFKGQTTPLSGQYKNGLFPKILFPSVIFRANKTTEKFKR